MVGNSLFHLIKVWMLVEKPDSQTTENEQLAIARYAKGAKVAVEIGVFEGVNTAIISRNMEKDGVLYGIDPFFKGRLGISYHKLAAKMNVRRKGNEKNVLYLEMLSFDAATSVPDNLDFIFVDGDHSYDGIERDWRLFSPKIKRGGIIALHDTSVPAHDPSVSQLGSYDFYNKEITSDARFEHVETIDSLNVLRRIM